MAGTHLADGEVFFIPPLTLRKGDFVDVSACISVAVLRGTNGRRFEVSFEPRVIVRLANTQKWTVSKGNIYVQKATLTLRRKSSLRLVCRLPERQPPIANL